MSEQLTILGELSATGSAGDGIYYPATASGALSAERRLAAAVPVGSSRGLTLVVGGGTVSSSALVQADSAVSGATAHPCVLPRSRADSTTETIGDIAYLVSGYDGSNFESAALSTTNSTRLQRVAAHPVPLRCPARRSSVATPPLPQPIALGAHPRPQQSS